ncbi:probable basic-leucine zipper transcription factor N [Condylostylus longicornis]|uniref:probable basic-leucine zipper transcription factor N n=1 Tax=Condylostylus longicornis TaxID=2530218 RepID=UPI00244E52F3|nr:probable basic-leucine zipper transcription factor N [Condylostylus longicornis]
MSTRHNYTNPAFCQQSEFYPTLSLTEQHKNHANKLSQLRLDTSLISVNGGLNDGTTISNIGVRRIQRSVSTRSFNTTTSSNKVNAINRSQILSNNSTPPKPGPKPTNLNRTINNTTNAFETTTRSGSGRYALVPVEELSNSNNINRYAIIPSSSTQQIQNKNITSIVEQPSSIKRTDSYRYAKSQENIDRYAHIPIKDEPASFNEESDTFTSLPPMTISEEQPRLKSAFSSDFGSKSFVLVDHKNNQKYAMVPTADDEDLVDDNHEIIQMHHGRVHRYAVIPTEEEDDDDEEEETCLSNTDLNQTYPNSQETIQLQPLQSSTPQKNPFRQQSVQRTPQLTPLQKANENYPTTPIKNPDATRRLHELLSTPRKTPKPTSNLTPNNISRNDIERNSKRYSSQSKIYVHGSRLNINHIRENELNPQKLVYDHAYQQPNKIKPIEQQYKSNKQNQKIKGNEARTTAIITPRVANYSNNTDNEDEDSCTKSSWNTSYPQKVANATATLGVISLMLTLGSIMNTGLCLYLIANNGRTFYLEFALAAAFAGVGLGILGFRTRHCEWLPNRSYISGYILLTVFCLLKCCGLLVLLALDPFPGIPLHDVTTGIVLGLSTFEVFFIGLGVLGSWWCHRPPPDNRVNVY